MKKFKKAKHKNDYNHGKDGRVGGNARYKRSKATERHNRTMGKSSDSRNF